MTIIGPIMVRCMHEITTASAFAVLMSLKSLFLKKQKLVVIQILV